MTNSQLHERDRVTKIQGVLDAFCEDLREHKDDCLTVRKETKDEMTALKETIEANHEDWKGVVAEMDRGNIKRLRWINGLLVTVLIGLMGFLGTQVWSHVIK